MIQLLLGLVALSFRTAAAGYVEGVFDEASPLIGDSPLSAVTAGFDCGMRKMALQRHGKKKMGQSFLPVETIKLLKEKGGDMYAAKKDRPAPAREMHM